jgi:hypothetical protein
MVTSGINLIKNKWIYTHNAEDIVLIGRNEIEIKQLLVEMENTIKKLGLQIKQEWRKYTIVERKNTNTK